MGLFPVLTNLMFVRWFFECLYYALQFEPVVVPRKGITNKLEYFAYLDTLPK